MRRLLFALIIVFLAVLGCSSDNSMSNANGGNLQLFLTDKPIDLDQVWVTISEIDVHQTGGAWQPFLQTSKTMDLLTLKNTRSLIGSASLDKGTYTGFRLLVNEGHVIDTSGQRCDLKVPSQKIEVPVNFEIQDQKSTQVVLDFNAEQSVHVTQTGNGEQCILRPVLTTVSVQTGS